MRLLSRQPLHLKPLLLGPKVSSMAVGLADGARVPDEDTALESGYGAKERLL